LDAEYINTNLSFKNTAAAFCTVDVETSGSCTAETSFTTNDYTTQSTFTSQPPAYKSLFETLDKKGIIIDKILTLYKEASTKTHVVEKGNTFWGIANSHNIGVNELLSVPGNEKYLGRRYVDERGKDNIKLYKDDIINLPSSSRTTNNYFDINKLRYHKIYILNQSILLQHRLKVINYLSQKNMGSYCSK
jgi:hypothetical protein